MVRRRQRDIYGNWVWEDEEEKEENNEVTQDPSQSEQDSSSLTTREEHNNGLRRIKETESLSLDWRDYIALTIASLETILLPIVVFVVVLIFLVFLVTHG